MTTAEFDTIGRCEVLNLTSQKWTVGRSRAPSCPPDDGGVAVIGGRYIYLPGTCPPPPTKETGLATAQSDPGRPGLRYDGSKYPGVFGVVVLVLIAVTVLLLILLAVTIILHVTIFQSQLVTSNTGSIHPYYSPPSAISHRIIICDELSFD